MGLGDSIKRAGHGSQFVIMAFHPDDRMAKLVYEALEWYLADNGLSLTEEIVNKAYAQSDLYPKLTVKKFVSGLLDGNY